MMMMMMRMEVVLLLTNSVTDDRVTCSVLKLLSWKKRDHLPRRHLRPDSPSIFVIFQKLT